MTLRVHPGTLVEEVEASKLILDIYFVSPTNTKMFELHAFHFYSNSLLTLKHLLKYIFRNIYAIYMPVTIVNDKRGHEREREREGYKGGLKGEGKAGTI